MRMNFTQEPHDFEYLGQLEAEKLFHDMLCSEYKKYENATYWKVVKILEHHNFNIYLHSNSKKITIVISSQQELNKLTSLVYKNKQFRELIKKYHGNKVFSRLPKDISCRYVEITA